MTAKRVRPATPARKSPTRKSAAAGPKPAAKRKAAAPAKAAAKAPAQLFASQASETVRNRGNSGATSAAPTTAKP